MKRTILYIPALLLLSMMACKKEQTPTWKAPGSIYFGFVLPTAGVSTDSLSLTFAFSPVTVTDTVVQVPISVLGLAADSNREFVLKADPASTAIAGKHFDMPAHPVIRAGRVKDSVAITFHRTPDMQTNVFLLVLDLEPNGNFDTNFTSVEKWDNTVLNATVLKITVGDVLVQPTYWPDYYYGPYSKKKLLLMNQVTGLPLGTFNGFDTINYWIFWGTEFQRWLNDQKAAGNTILDENGLPMAMDPSIG